GWALSTDAATHANTQVGQKPPCDGRYKRIEASINRRLSHSYSLSAGYGYTWRHDFPYGYPNTQNGPFDYDFSSAGFKANGTYTAPWSILISGVYRYQLGENYARRVSVSAPVSCACTFSSAAGGNGSIA